MHTKAQALAVNPDSRTPRVQVPDRSRCKGESTLPRIVVAVLGSWGFDRSNISQLAKAVFQPIPAKKWFLQRYCRPTSAGSKYVTQKDDQAWPRTAQQPMHTSRYS